MRRGPMPHRLAQLRGDARFQRAIRRAAVGLQIGHRTSNGKQPTDRQPNAVQPRLVAVTATLAPHAATEAQTRAQLCPEGLRLRFVQGLVVIAWSRPGL